ncbi:pantoate--beta-alanine ligase [Acetobacter fallax]|uniref:Pantothenate synthetase n=1 Tax=Acetobacter fallax TaxID=1737473 RepID=A0ABX0KBS0_9PROT|nr:pantoate--beta-alanine ligase [Acetobacter fallax]NHO32601.1 pantoate--beta-alanine ligase [Acetobacter fallax]NHO36201.1 pantoate--beta-alanine ligase [Acetobacter fallax]
MQVFSTISAVRAARPRIGTLGFVPTMGFLHDGHLSLVRRAVTECDNVAVSIFVNPTQFCPGEDFSRYPRNMEHDLALLREAGVTFVFTPEPAEMYPPRFATSIDVGAVAHPLEGAVRPGHFSGVATIVCKLFNIVQPARAYFGQKDAQQCAVIRQLVADLNLPIEIVTGEIIRNSEGLALSSRNSYLSEADRTRATVLHAALQAARTQVEAGERNVDVLKTVIRDILTREPDFLVDYISIADPDSLHELSRIEHKSLASLAVRVGPTRLLDNVILQPVL